MGEFITFVQTVGGGLAGALLTFYLWKLVPEQRAIWRALDRMNTIRIMGIVASAHVSPEIKEEATRILGEIAKEEEASKRRERLPP